MNIGIFAKTFQRPTLEGILDAVHAHGIKHVQFNMACAGLPSMPDTIDNILCARVREGLARRGIEMAAVSGTFNVIHPDTARRGRDMERLRVLAEACPSLGTSIITMSTGTCDAEDMWRRHPENDSAEAWAELCASMAHALEITEHTGVTLAFEPEISNVVDSAAKARRLLDEMKTPRLKVVFDAANLFHKGELVRMRSILDEAFELLGNAIVLAHAKDLARDGAAGNLAAGTGLLDYDYYIDHLRRAGYKGPLVLHSLDESQVNQSVRFLREKLGG